MKKKTMKIFKFFTDCDVIKGEENRKSFNIYQQPV